jgi:DNA-binding SARP family transcriptional activator/predicted negative regulator of RcsB-dependent stress response
VEFELLGPVRVRIGGRAVVAGSGRERFVLAMLLLEAGRLVRVDRLVDALWERPPRSAKAQVHNMISRWRRRFGVDADRVIVTRPLGYELLLGEHRLDLVEFRTLVAGAQQAIEDGDHGAAASGLAEALALWRGPALADVPDELIADARLALHDERLAATEALLDCELALARYDTVLSMLGPLIEDHPYREQLYRTRMLALVGAGRRVEALETYRQAYRRLADDLGVEPGPALRELEQRILRGEGVTVAAVVPRQLPPVTGTLTGRDKLVVEIHGQLRTHDGLAPAVALLVGPGGVGKTTLAVAAAHTSAEAFPDGQLYADLRGSHQPPADPHAVLARLLRATGIDGAAVPAGREERVALYRSQLAGRRMLILLDDAASEEQVRPLLPGTAGCGVLVTSRHQLAALVDASRWTVPVLESRDALDLLTRIAGRERILAEPDLAERIVALCGHLPLAVTIAGARLAAQPHQTLANYARRLAQERSRLDELTVGDLDVRASITLTYRALNPQQRRLFRRLGLTRAPDWPAWVADELLGAPGAPVLRLLDQLAEVHLLEPLGLDPAGQHRFRLHDLVADFARERAAEEDPEPERTAALSRVLTGWLALATEADELLEHGMVSAAGLSAPPQPAGAGAAARKAPRPWFEAERANLVTAIEQAGRLDNADLATRLALRTAGFLALRSYHDDREQTLRDAFAYARGHIEDELMARLLNALFAVLAERSRNAELPAVAAELLAVARRLGDLQAEVRALNHLGLAVRRQGRLAGAAALLTHAVDLATDLADREEQHNELLGKALKMLAIVHQDAGHANAAVTASGRALKLLRQTGKQRLIAMVTVTHAVSLLDTGRLDEAEQTLADAAGIVHQLDDELGRVTIEQLLAEIDIRRGAWASAEQRLDRTLRFHESRGDPADLSEALRCIGDLAYFRGSPQDAIPLYRRCLQIRRRLDTPVSIARILARLDRALADAGQPDAAAEHRHEYLTILAELQLDDACLRLPPAMAHDTMDDP